MSAFGDPAAAHAVGPFARAGVALYDRSAQVLHGVNLDDPMPSASVYKVLLAARLLHGVLTPAERDLLWRMIIDSSNDATNALHSHWGGASVTVDWVRQTYGVGFTAAATGAWGDTLVTARALVDFYRAMMADPQVHPWLYDAMAHTTPTGGSGWGIPQVATGWAVKHGWYDGTTGSVIHSTGFVHDAAFIVVLLTHDPRHEVYSSGDGFTWVTTMARTLLTP